MQEQNRVKAILLIISLFFATAAIALFVPPIAQSLGYHNFADTTTLCGVANVWNVASNASFLVAGVAGLIFMLQENVRKSGRTFIDSAEWWPYFAFFVGVTATAFGSAYYHWAPDNNTLLWYRLPLGIMFMGLFAAVIAERIAVDAGGYLTLPLVLFGASTVVNWTVTEHLGLGDLRLYAVVQFFPIVCVPVILRSFPARYTRANDLLVSIGWYALAKVFETFDLSVYTAIGISGHTIKHVLCGVSAYWIVRMLRQRQPLPALASTDSSPS